MSVLPVGIAASGDEAYTLDNSLRFRSSASAYLSRTPGSASNQKTWTWSGWVKRSKLGSLQNIFNPVTGGDGTNESQFKFNANDTIQVYDSGGLRGNFVTTQVFRDVSAWYHIVVVLDTTQATSTNRFKLYVNGVQVTAFSTASYPSQNTDWGWNRTVRHDIGRYAYGSTQYSDGYMTEINFIDGQALTADDFGEFDATTGVWKPKAYSGTYGTNGFYLPTTATTQAEGFNTVLFTGTSQDNQTISNVGFQPDLVWLKSRSNAQNHYLIDSVRGGNSFLYSNATSAENTTRSWLTEFTNNGFTVTDQIISNGYTYAAWTWDAGANQASTGISSVAYTGNGVPMKVSGFGFSPDLVWIKRRDSAANHCLTDTVRGATNTLFSDGTFAESTGLDGVTSFDSDGVTLGTNASHNSAANTFIAWGWDAGDGDPVTNTQGTITSTVKANDANGFSIVSYTGDGNTGGVGSTVGHGLSTAPKVIIYKNRDSSTLNWMFTTTAIDGSVDFLFLNTTNSFGKTDSTENAPTSSVFSVAYNHNNTSGNDIIAYCFSEVSGVSSFGSYTGTGSAGNSVTGLGFRPGFLMIKRTDAAAEWVMVDSTRDPFNSANHILAANDSLAESSFGTTNRNIDFDDDGFTIQSTAAGGTTALNASGGTYMYMAFKGSYSDYVSPLNTNGSIDSRVKANTEKGFSIVSWEGNGSNSTIGHGLSSAPEFFFLKNRDTSVNDWIVYQSDVGATKFLRLNQTNATTTQTNIFNDTAPTSSVFTVGTNSAVNSSGVNYIAYCFHSVAGYSKFGSYTGTGVSGNTVTTGFRPAWVMMKSSTNASTPWQIFDNTREPQNPVEQTLIANNSNAEPYDTASPINFTDTGFELLGGASSWNNYNTGTWIYAAFADTRDAQFNFDASGNKNNWTPNNINSNASSESSYDIMTDVPTLTDENTANYCTWNPLRPSQMAGGTATIADGNLKASDSGTSYGVFAQGTIAVSSGKWYWEIDASTVGGTYGTVGIRLESLQGTDGAGYFYQSSGNKVTTIYGGGSASYGSSYTSGDNIGIALDLDAGTLAFYKNGVSQGTAFSSLSGSFSACVGDGQNATQYVWNANFGQRPFAYTPPTGFLPLNTYNLPDSTIEDGSKQFNTVLYTGNGSTQSITGVGFQPDLLWLKRRDSAENHGIHDAVRGSTKFWVSNLTVNEYTRANSVTSFDSDGFSLGDYSNINASSSSMVGWAWKGNNGTVSNTDGSITTTVSANPTAGISIFTYTGSGGASDTLGHGLGVAPEWVFVHDLSSATFTSCYHIGTHPTVPASYLMRLNTTDARLSSSVYWNNTKPTSSVVTIGTSSAINDTNNYVMYCFAPVEGFSSFGSYTGNGSADGPFVYTGFRPAWLFVKRTDAANWWEVWDAKRNTYNVVNKYLAFQASDAEYTGSTTDLIDFLSNGFKVRASNAAPNASGGTYIYGAFAENPFKNSLAR